MSSSEDEDVDIEKKLSSRLPPHKADSKAAADAPKSGKVAKETQLAKIDPPNPDATGNAPKQEVKDAVNGTKKSVQESNKMDKGSGVVDAAQSQQPTKRRGRPPGSKNKIKKAKPEPPAASEAPKAVDNRSLPLPKHTETAPLVEPVTKRAKIQAELQQGLHPVAIGMANAGISEAPKPVPIRPQQPEFQSVSGLTKIEKEMPSTDPVTAAKTAAKEVAATATTAAAVATTKRENIPLLASAQPAIPSPKENPTTLASERPSKDNNFPSSKPSEQKLNSSLDLAPGEALRTWLEENKTQVIEEKLIEELPEDIPLHQPSAEEIASNVACAGFQALLPGLKSNREAISQATAAALKVAATGASARAVRMVVDAASDAAGPQERLPYLYLLDSAVKLELRQAQEQEKEENKKESLQSSSGFRRAVGAALQRLVHLLLGGDDQIRKKVDKLLGIWQREGLIAASLIEPVMESLQHDAEKQKKEKAAAQDDQLELLLKQTPMNTTMKITYTMPNGEDVVVQLPAHNAEPDDWTMPRHLGIEVPSQPRAVRKMKFLSSSSSGPVPHNPHQSQEGDMSPWCREKQYEAQYGGPHDGMSGNINKFLINGHDHGHFFNISNKPAPPPMPPVHQQGLTTLHNPAAVAADELEEGEVELDEFDQGLLRDAYGIGGADGGSSGGGGTGGPPPVPVPPSVPSYPPINNGFNPEGGTAQWGGMPNSNAVFVANGGEAQDVMQWQLMQQQAQAQELMMMRNHSIMTGGSIGMNNVILPQQQMQQMQLPHQAVVGEFGVAPAMGMAAMGMGMQLPSQEQQFAMMNASMMGGNDFGEDYGYGGAAMGMQQQQQHQGGGGGGGQYDRRGGGGGGPQRGHDRQGGGNNNRQHRHQPYQHHHQQQHNRHDSKNARR